MFRCFPVEKLASLSPRRVVVIKPSAFGDVAQSLPLLPALRRAYPQAEIAWVVNRELQPLLSGHPDLHETIPFDRRGGWCSWIRVLSQLRSGRFDLAIDLQGLLRTGVMTAATGAPVRVGLETAREGSHWTTNCVIPDSSRAVAAHARYWRVAEAIGQVDCPRRTVVTVAPDDRSNIAARLAPFPRPWLAIHPGAKWVTKRWPVEQMARVVERFLRETGGSAFVVGAPDEAPLAKELVERTPFPDRVASLAGATSLKQLAVVLEMADLFLGCDSGPMHLAAGLGTPVVAVFTCTNPAISGPVGTRNSVFSADVPCAASYKKTCPQPGVRRHCCFAAVNAEAVAEAVLHWANESQTRAA